MAAKQLKRPSKALSWLLRHGAEKEGLAIRSDGFVRLAEILAHRSLRGASLGSGGRVYFGKKVSTRHVA